MLPHDYPLWKTVHLYLRMWRKDGTWERIHAALRKSVRVRKKRDLMVDTEGFVLKARVHSAKVMDHEEIKMLLEGADEAFPHLRHLRLGAGYRGEDTGADWVQTTLGWSVELVERSRKPAPEGVLMAWAKKWDREGESVEYERLAATSEAFIYVAMSRFMVKR